LKPEASDLETACALEWRTVPYYTVLSCTVQYSIYTLLKRTGLYCTVLYSILKHCIALYCYSLALLQLLDSEAVETLRTEREIPSFRPGDVLAMKVVSAASQR